MTSAGWSGLLLLALAAAPAGAAADVDVLRCDLEVSLRGKDLAVAATIRAAGRPPGKWALELVPEMRVLSAESGGRAVPFSASGRALALDLSGVPAPPGGEFSVLVRCEGSPSERFSEGRGGFVRSAVGPDLAFVRSQVPWYPRAPGDLAVHRVAVDAPAAWQVRTAGDFAPPAPKGERALWTFETKAPVERVGLAAGPWKVVSSGTFDALVVPAHEGSAAEVLATARKAMEFHASDLGPVRRARFALVELPAAFGSGSGYAECGYLLLGPGPFEAPGADWVAGFLAHETAHQWWGHEALFSDFASEALTEYSALRCTAALGGPAAAVRMRRAAVERVAKAAADGKSIPMADVRGWGGDMDPEAYRVHAYEKPMMILAMVEEALGSAVLQKHLRALLDRGRVRRTGWKELREALAAAGPAARTVVEQWEGPGLPSLEVRSGAKEAAGGWTVSGRVIQSGAPKPLRMRVRVAALCGGKRVETEARLEGAEAPFSLKAPAEPEAVLVDPDWLLLAARPTGGAGDPRKTLLDAFGVAKEKADADAAELEGALGRLRGLLEAGSVAGGEAALCATGIGHCLFRLGRLEEAEAAYGDALARGAGGPFHVGWVRLRLGNIDDLRGRRKEAREHYREAAESPGGSKAAAEKAKRFLEKPYRGWREDG